MKVENATIGTRVIAKDLSDSYLGGLDNAEGQAGVIVVEYEPNGKLVNDEPSPINFPVPVNVILLFNAIEFVASNFKYLVSFIEVVAYELKLMLAVSVELL